MKLSKLKHSGQHHTGHRMIHGHKVHHSGEAGKTFGHVKHAMEGHNKSDGHIGGERSKLSSHKPSRAHHARGGEVMKGMDKSRPDEKPEVSSPSDLKRVERGMPRVDGETRKHGGKVKRSCRARGGEVFKDDEKDRPFSKKGEAPDEDGEAEEKKGSPAGYARGGHVKRHHHALGGSSSSNDAAHPKSGEALPADDAAVPGTSGGAALGMGPSGGSSDSTSSQSAKKGGGVWRYAKGGRIQYFVPHKAKPAEPERKEKGWAENSRLGSEGKDDNGENLKGPMGWAHGGRLTAKARKAIPTKSFAGPDRSYPIEDASHARNALSRVSQFGSPELKSRVRAAVHRKYPGIGKDDD